MLPKKYRLKNNRAFEATYSQRKRVSDEFVILYFGRLKKEPAYDTKIGFVVNKKYSKRAVKRNRAKRLFREAFRLLLKEGAISKIELFQSLIFFVKQYEQKLSLEIAKKSILNLLNRGVEKYL